MDTHLSVLGDGGTNSCIAVALASSPEARESLVFRYRMTKLGLK